MGTNPASEALAVAEAFRHLGIDVDADGGQVRHRGTGEMIHVHLDEPQPGTRSQIVVRDRVTPAARHQFLHDRIGWLDLRGHLSFRSPNLVVEADVPGIADRSTQRRTSVLAGAVVSGVTMAALAAWPEPLEGVRPTARILSATPGGVSLAIKRLVAAGYMTSDHRATAELFWTAASEWRPEWVELPVHSLPPGAEATAVGGLAAALIGAPAAVTAETTPEYLVASPTSLQYGRMSARTHDADGPTARYTVAPAPIAAQIRYPGGVAVNTIPVAAEAIVALSLAIDPARGAETVRSWGGDHVWS